jgi:hypothetical protein
MDKVERVKRISELFELVQYYYEYRDQPMAESFNFEAKVQTCCHALDLDFTEFVKEFKLQPY